jgi:deoxyribodipyrimidine photo-lyase
VVVRECEPDLLHDPDSLRTGTGKSFRVFTPFSRAFLARPLPAPTCGPPRLPSPGSWPPADPRWSADAIGDGAGDAFQTATSWEPGFSGAEHRAARFLGGRLATYPRDRDLPAVDGTSRLSAHLAAGEIGPRRLWSLVEEAGRDSGPGPAGDGAAAFRRQLAWREFGYHLLAHEPTTPDTPMRASFASFPWEEDPAGEAAWQTGRTGYPLVDAGVRQLLASGWMHNRVRMVAASFLVKDLLVPWQHGARFFWERLVDADLANNTLGWQWVAGSGADAAPFFRIFNPVLQGQRYDPDGAYVRRWVPEIAGLPDRFIHAPWRAPGDTLAQAGVHLGETYPLPLVEHGEARRRALAAFAQMRGR